MKNCIDCNIPFSIRNFYKKDNSKPNEKALIRCRNCRLNRRGNNMIADKRVAEFYKAIMINGGKLKNNMINCECGRIINKISFRKHMKSKIHNRPCNPIENLDLFFQI